jgi:hypothetical protein
MFYINLYQNKYYFKLAYVWYHGEYSITTVDHHDSDISTTIPNTGTEPEKIIEGGGNITLDK